MQARFHLCLHAYLLEPADTTPIVIDDPQWAGREFMTPDDPDDPASAVTLRPDGMAAFSQGTDSARHDCEFCAPVKDVRNPEGHAFGHPHWPLALTVIRATEAPTQNSHPANA